ncbi:hypothetical protein L218DRAFT_667278 [Marasmius fiardii PR-910]|nr:hypothetical protein L218DRAFT_667278 [Marasmius fiardii PR-910]
MTRIAQFFEMVYPADRSSQQPRISVVRIHVTSSRGLRTEIPSLAAHRAPRRSNVYGPPPARKRNHAVDGQNAIVNGQFPTSTYLINPFLFLTGIAIPLVPSLFIPRTNIF